MGCGPSKEEQDFDARLGAPASRDSLLGSGKVNGSSIRAKVEAANDMSLSQTQHIHHLGIVTVTENPFDCLDSCALDDLLLLDACQVSGEPVTPDLEDVDAVVRQMLLPSWGQCQGDGEGQDETVS